MSGNANRIVLGVMTGLMAGVLSAETYTWKGGASGSWTEAANWQDSSGTSTAYPHAADDKVVFPDAAGTVSISVGEEISIFNLNIKPQAKVTFGGGGSLTCTSSENDWTKASYIEGSLTVNDLTVTNRSQTYIYGDLVLEEGSSWLAPGQGQSVREGATASATRGGKVTINGGYHYFRGLYANSKVAGQPATIEINGGSVAGAKPDGTGRSDVYSGNGQKTSSDYAGNKVIVNGGDHRIWLVADPGTEWHVCGGRVNAVHLWAYGGKFYVHDGGTFEFSNPEEAFAGKREWDTDAFVFEPGSRLVWSAAYSTFDQTLFSRPCTVEFGNANALLNAANAPNVLMNVSGTLVATNGPDAGVSTYDDYSGFEGRGTFIVSRFVVPGGKYGNIDAEKIILGTKLNITGSAQADFNGPITFGAFGDWKHLGTSSSDTFFHGDVVVDTLDWFDRTTPHAVSLHGVRPDQGLRLDVIGGGSLEYGMAIRSYSGISYRKLRPWHVVHIGANTTLTLTNTAFCCDKLVMEPGAKLAFTAVESAVEAKSIEIDPTARIEVSVPATVNGDCVLLTGAFGELADGVLSVTGTPASHTLTLLKGNWYLDDGVEPTHTETDNKPSFWTGAVSGKYYDAGNWSGGKVPYNWNYRSGGQFAAFDGFTNLDVVNDTKGWTWHNVTFLKTSGPFTLSGSDAKKIYSGWGAADPLAVSNATFGTLSRFPIKVTAKTSNYDAYCSLVADTPSYLELTGGVQTPDGQGGNKVGQLGVGGDVCVGGTSWADYVVFTGYTFDPRAKDSRLTVLSGGDFTVKKQTSAWASQYQGLEVRGSFMVCENAKLTFSADAQAKYDYNGAGQQNRIDGEMDIACEMLVRTKALFRGTGSLHVAGTRGVGIEAIGETALAGGLTFSADGWQTAWDADGYTKFGQRLAVADGTVYLTAPTAWTYGVPATVATEVPAAARALRLGKAGELVLACTENPVTFADPIVGPGKLTFAEGAQIRLGGALLASKPVGKWIEFARVGSVENLPTQLGGMLVKRVANDDGTLSLLAKDASGLMIFVR